MAKSTTIRRRRVDWTVSMRWMSLASRRVGVSEVEWAGGVVEVVAAEGPVGMTDTPNTRIEASSNVLSTSSGESNRLIPSLTASKSRLSWRASTLRDGPASMFCSLSRRLLALPSTFTCSLWLQMSIILSIHAAVVRCSCWLC